LQGRTLTEKITGGAGYETHIVEKRYTGDLGPWRIVHPTKRDEKKKLGHTKTCYFTRFKNKKEMLTSFTSKERTEKKKRERKQTTPPWIVEKGRRKDIKVLGVVV